MLHLKLHLLRGENNMPLLLESWLLLMVLFLIGLFIGKLIWDRS
jgi:hypothetical protein